MSHAENVSVQLDAGPQARLAHPPRRVARSRLPRRRRRHARAMSRPPHSVPGVRRPSSPPPCPSLVAAPNTQDAVARRVAAANAAADAKARAKAAQAKAKAAWARKAAPATAKGNTLLSPSIEKLARRLSRAKAGQAAAAARLRSCARRLRR